MRDEVKCERCRRVISCGSFCRECEEKGYAKQVIDEYHRIYQVKVRF